MHDNRLDFRFTNGLNAGYRLRKKRRLPVMSAVAFFAVALVLSLVLIKEVEIVHFLFSFAETFENDKTINLFFSLVN